MDLLSYRTLGAEAPLSRRMPERVLPPKGLTI